MQHKSGVKIYGPRYWPKKETKLNLFIFLSIGHDGTQSNFCNINMAFLGSITFYIVEMECWILPQKLLKGALVLQYLRVPEINIPIC